MNNLNILLAIILFYICPCIVLLRYFKSQFDKNLNVKDKDFTNLDDLTETIQILISITPFVNFAMGIVLIYNKLTEKIWKKKQD